MPSFKYKHLSLSLPKPEVGEHGTVIGKWRCQCCALNHLKILWWKYIVYSKSWRDMNIASSNSKTFFNKSILQITPDMEISIGIGNIIKVATNDQRIWAFVQMHSYRVSLETTQPQCASQFFCERSWCLQHTVFCVADYFDVPEIPGLE